MDGTKASQVCWFSKGRYFMYKDMMCIRVYIYIRNEPIHLLQEQKDSSIHERQARSSLEV